MKGRTAFWMLWIGTAAVFTAYALAMMEYGLDIWAGRLPRRALDFMAMVTSSDLVWGDNGFVEPVYTVFARNKGAMTLHILAGSVALALGSSQFVPAIRRHWPRLHRVTGAVVLAATLTTVTGAAVRLASEPPQETWAGPAFHMVLWYLAVVSLFFTLRAVAALVRRDYRQHMLWMALAWSGYLTAPSLRISTLSSYWHYEGSHDHLQFSAASFAWVLTGFLMLLWLQVVGDRDQPARSVGATHWPRWASWTLAASAAALAIHEGVLAPLGADAVAGMRGETGTLPVTAIPWGVSAAVSAVGGVQALEAWLAGGRPRGWWLASVALTAVGAWIVAASTPAVGLLVQPVNAVFLTMGGALFALLLAARMSGPNSLGRNPWGVTLAFFVWTPSVLLLGLAIGLPIGLRADEMYALGHVLGPTSMTLLGIATGWHTAPQVATDIPSLRSAISPAP